MISKLQTAVANPTKAFLATIERFRYHYDIRDVFRDWCELAAAEVHQLPYHAKVCRRDEAFEAVEEQYLQVAKRYEAKDFDVFADLLAITRLALEQDYCDFLGSAFMQLEISSDWHGQFFTPYDVSLLIARLSLSSVAETIDTQGYISLHEPACGAGGMVIAAAQMVHEAYRNPSTGLYFQAVDVDRMCANMAYIQTGLKGLTGVVWHGNTLTTQMYGGRWTPAARLHPGLANAMAAGEPWGAGTEGEPVQMGLMETEVTG